MTPQATLFDVTSGLESGFMSMVKVFSMLFSMASGSTFWLVWTSWIYRTVNKLVLLPVLAKRPTYHNRSADDARQEQSLTEVLDVQVFAVVLERSDETARVRSQAEDRIEVGVLRAELAAGRFAASGQLAVIVNVDRVEVVFFQVANSDVEVDRIASLMRRR